MKTVIPIALLHVNHECSQFPNEDNIIITNPNKHLSSEMGEGFLMADKHVVVIKETFYYFFFKIYF